MNAQTTELKSEIKNCHSQLSRLVAENMRLASSIKAVDNRIDIQESHISELRDRLDNGIVVERQQLIEYTEQTEAVTITEQMAVGNEAVEQQETQAARLAPLKSAIKDQSDTSSVPNLANAVSF